MRFVGLSAAAAIAWWLVMPVGDEAPSRLSIEMGLVAIIAGAFFGALGWLYARKGGRPATFRAAGHILWIIGILGFGGAYGPARAAGHGLGSAFLTAWAGWPIMLIILAMAAFNQARRADA